MSPVSDQAMATVSTENIVDLPPWASLPLLGRTYMTAAIEPEDATEGGRGNGPIETIDCPSSLVQLGLDKIHERPLLGRGRVGVLHGLHDGRPFGHRIVSGRARMRGVSRP